ncbi:MAG: hypothetical protein AAF633_04460 [Chloroflexota bacterium]
MSYGTPSHDPPKPILLLSHVSKENDLSNHSTLNQENSHEQRCPYTIKSILGLDTSTFFFDEIRGADALGISPLIPVIISLSIGVLGTVYFSRKTKQGHGLLTMILMIIGTFAGIYLWSLVGPVIFPGGHGFN